MIAPDPGSYSARATVTGAGHHLCGPRGTPVASAGARQHRGHVQGRSCWPGHGHEHLR